MSKSQAKRFDKCLKDFRGKGNKYAICRDSVLGKIKHKREADNMSEEVRAEARDLIAAGDIEGALAVLDRAGGDGLPFQKRHERKLNGAMRHMRIAHRMARECVRAFAQQGGDDTEDEKGDAERAIATLKRLGVIGEKGGRALSERATVKFGAAKDPEPDGNVEDGEESDDPNAEADENDPGDKGPHGRKIVNVEDDNPDNEEAWGSADDDPDSKTGRKRKRQRAAIEAKLREAGFDDDDVEKALEAFDRSQDDGDVKAGEESDPPMDAHDPGSKGPHGRAAKKPKKDLKPQDDADENDDDGDEVQKTLRDMGLDEDEIAVVIDAVDRSRRVRVKKDVGQGGPDADDDDDDAGAGPGPGKRGKKRSKSDGNVDAGEEGDSGDDLDDDGGAPQPHDKPSGKNDNVVKKDLTDDEVRAIDAALESGELEIESEE